MGVDALDAALQEVQNGNMTGTVLSDAVGQATAAVAEVEKLLGTLRVSQTQLVEIAKAVSADCGVGADIRHLERERLHLTAVGRLSSERKMPDA